MTNAFCLMNFKIVKERERGWLEEDYNRKTAITSDNGDKFVQAILELDKKHNAFKVLGLYTIKHY